MEPFTRMVPCVNEILIIMELIIFIALALAIGFFPAIWAIISVIFGIIFYGFLICLGLFVIYMALALMGGIFVGLKNLFLIPPKNAHKISKIIER